MVPGDEINILPFIFPRSEVSPNTLRQLSSRHLLAICVDKFICWCVVFDKGRKVHEAAVMASKTLVVDNDNIV
jgi:hypothetical protein